MKLFIGLGNPGAKHAGNRHNVGFMAVDAIAAAHGFSSWRQRHKGEISEGVLDGEKVLLLKPATYMNESGRAAAEAMRFYKLAPSDVAVFHDELDLAPGKVRVKTGGGAAGHNGLRSIGAHVGADYTRVRIGIGHPGHKSQVTGHVLRDFSKTDREWVQPLMAAIAKAAPKLARDDAANFMNTIATETSDPAVSLSTMPEGRTPSRAGPSQRDPARSTAKRQDAGTADETPAPADGPLAGLLRRWRDTGKRG